MLEQRESLQQQSRALETLAEGKSRAEERLGLVTSDLQGREQRAREDQRQIASLTHSLQQVSEREREVRPGVKCPQSVSPEYTLEIQSSRQSTIWICSVSHSGNEQCTHSSIPLA